MLSRKRQEKYFKKRWKSFRKHLRAYFDSMNPEELHEVRVQIKKIKALALLYKYQGDKNVADDFEPLKKIFKRAGRVRNAQVNLQLIEKYDLQNEKFKDEQVSDLVFRTGRFCSEHDNFLDAQKKIYDKIPSEIHGLKKKFILQICKKQQKKLSHWLAAYNQQSRLHQCRKKIKFLLYLYQMLPIRFAGKLKINIKYLGSLEQSIGQWHDTVSAIELLKAKNYSDKTVLKRLEIQAARELRLVRSASSFFSDKVQA